MQVDIAKVEIKKVDDNVECIYKQRVKLYRFTDNQWKERGVGNLKMLRDKTNRKIRVLMRQEKTFKPVANFMCKSHFKLALKSGSNLSDILLFIVVSEDPLCMLTLMANNNKAYVWTCADFSDGEQKMEKQAARFNTLEAANEFKAAFVAAKAFNLKAKQEGVKDDDLEWAPTVEDVDEPVVDDIDINKTADEDGDK